MGFVWATGSEPWGYEVRRGNWPSDFTALDHVCFRVNRVVDEAARGWLRDSSRRFLFLFTVRWRQCLLRGWRSWCCFVLWSLFHCNSEAFMCSAFWVQDKFPFGDNKVYHICKVPKHSCPPPGQLASLSPCPSSVQALFNFHWRPLWSQAATAVKHKTDKERERAPLN